MRVAANSILGGLIRIAADSVPRLTRVPVAGYKLQLTADSIVGRTRVPRLLDTT